MKTSFEKIETCAACGYRATASTPPFIMSSLIAAYEIPESKRETHTVVYICPYCGTLQVSQPVSTEGK